MNFWKKAAPVAAAACLLAVSMAACSPAQTTSSGTGSQVSSQPVSQAWVAKNENSTISTGMYQYYLVRAYNIALNQRQDFSTSVFEQQIDGKPAEDWIREQALDAVKQHLLVNDLMKEYNLTVSSEDALLASQRSDSYWQQASQWFQPYGITKAEAKAAEFDFQVKNTTVFEHQYSTGDQAISDAEVEQYVKEHYTAFRYVLRSMYSGYQSLPESEVSALRTQFQNYAASIRNGSMTMEDAAMDLAKKEAEKSTASSSSSGVLAEPVDLDELAEHELKTRILNLGSDAEEQQQAGYPTELLDALRSMRNGEVRMVETQEGFFITVVKDNIDEVAKERVKDPEGHREILIDWKGAEYNEALHKRLESYTDYELNEKEYQFDLREYFEPADPASAVTSTVSSSAVSSQS